MITVVTIGLCYLTQLVAGWFGVTLREQDNLELVRRSAGLNWNFAFLCAQIIVLLPAIEEILFRAILFRLPCRLTHCDRSVPAALALPLTIACLSAGLFSFAHYPDYLHLANGFALRPLDNAFVALFFFGLAQCGLYWKTGRLWCAILNHGLFNLTNLVLLFLIPAA